MSDEIFFELNAPEFQADKYGYIEELRQQNFYGRTSNGVVFFNQEDAMHVMRCIDFRFSFFQITPDKSEYLSESIKHELLNKHGNEHKRLQKLVLLALRDQIVDGLENEIRANVSELINAMPDKGVTDFCSAFAKPLPAKVLGPMLGIPYEDIPDFNRWIEIGGRKVDALRSGDGIQEVEDANRNMHNYIRGMLRERRENLGADVFSELIVAEIDGDRLSEVELVSLGAEIAAAGVDTTRAQLPLTLEALLNHPKQFALLQNDPSLAMGAVDEGMRFAPLPFALPHAATHKNEYKGIHFNEGDMAMILVPAANRDPSAMADPAVFDISRKRVRNFAFGYGMHYCTGAQLARMEMAIALEELVKQIKSFNLVEEPEREPFTKGSAPTKMLIEIEKR